MRFNGVLLIGSLLSVAILETNGARILGLFHLHAKSHFSMFEALMKGLASRGHEVFVVSHFPQSKNIPNYTDLSLKGSIASVVNNMTVEMARNLGQINSLILFWPTCVDFCRNALNQPAMQNLIKTNETFDLIITEIFGEDCCYGFAHKFNIPIIGMVSNVPPTWPNYRLGNPENPSYIPNYFSHYKPPMSFKERVINTLLHVGTLWGQYIFAELPTDKLLQQHFGSSLPPLSELTKRTSLILVNSHFSMDMPRPTVPAYVEVGGLHISDKKTNMSESLKSFLDEADQGVIYFSLGSLVRGETLPDEKMHVFIETFKKLPQKILWKMNSSGLENLPSNIKTFMWLPQAEVLSHPNVRVFISHGGQLSSQESVYAGVPVIGIPLFTDQAQNVNKLVNKGTAVLLDFDDITEETLTEALHTILNDPGYRQRAQALSKIFRDRPETPLETAVYWTEYVIRHGGAPHLRSAAVDLPLYQYLLLDVIGVMLLGLIAIIAIIWFTLKKILGIIYSIQSKNKSIKKKLKCS